MRNIYIIFSLTILGLLSASGASAGVYSYIIGQNTGESNARYEADLKAKQEGRISCVPQPSSSDNLWNCEDAYGNKFDNLVITYKEQKNGNLKRARN